MDFSNPPMLLETPTEGALPIEIARSGIIILLVTTLGNHILLNTLSFLLLLYKCCKLQSDYKKRAHFELDKNITGTLQKKRHFLRFSKFLPERSHAQ